MSAEAVPSVLERSDFIAGDLGGAPQELKDRFAILRGCAAASAGHDQALQEPLETAAASEEEGSSFDSIHESFDEGEASLFRTGAELGLDGEAELAKLSELFLLTQSALHRGYF